MLKRVAIALAVLVVVFAIGGFVLPSDYAFARSVVIDAPPAKVHELVGDLRGWQRWSPWESGDPLLHAKLGAATAGVGASQTWTSDSGRGVLEFTRCDPSTGVEFAFVLDDRHEGRGVLRYDAEGGRTKVTWQLEGEMRGWSGPYMAMFMEKLAGPRFADGLRNLKAAAESGGR